MTLLDRVRWNIAYRVERFHLSRRWRQLRRHGLQLGTDVWLPRSTWIDPDYGYLISIGDHCGFGEECVILAHDAQMDEVLNGTRVARVVIRESSHIGVRTVILPGVEIGPRTIVGANSVVTRSLPPDTVCAGNPARVLCTLGDYLSRHRLGMQSCPALPYSTIVGPDVSEQLRHLTHSGSVYITGGRAAELLGDGGTPRTSAPGANS